MLFAEIDRGPTTGDAKAEVHRVPMPLRMRDSVAPPDGDHGPPLTGAGGACMRRSTSQNRRDEQLVLFEERRAHHRLVDGGRRVATFAATSRSSDASVSSARRDHTDDLARNGRI